MQLKMLPVICNIANFGNSYANDARVAVSAKIARVQAVVVKNATTPLPGYIQTMRIAVSKKATVSKQEIVRRSGCRCV